VIYKDLKLKYFYHQIHFHKEPKQEVVQVCDLDHAMNLEYEKTTKKKQNKFKTVKIIKEFPFKKLRKNSIFELPSHRNTKSNTK